MGWGWGWALLWGVLGTGHALLCPLCDVTGCRPISCPSPRSVCRRSSLTLLTGGRELRRESSGCDVTGVPDVVITFRSHGELVTLREERWEGGAGPRPGHAHGAAEDTPTAGGGPPLLCPTCDSSDGSCGRPLAALPCPRPRDRCIDVISRGPAGEGAGRLRGCGQAGPSPGLLAFDTGNGRGVELLSCESAQCGLGAGPPSGLRCWGCDGPAPSGCAPQVLPCGAGRTRCATAWGHGPSGEPWLVRGCATPKWCQSPVGLGGLWGASVGQGGSMGQQSMGQNPTKQNSMGHNSTGQDSMGQGDSVGLGGSMGQDPVGLSCCQGPLCNSLPGDPSPPHSAAPPPLLPLPLLLLLLAAPQV